MQPKIGYHMSRLRRVAFSFRDIALSSILKVAVKTLQQFDAGAIRVPNDEEETRLLKQVLQLANNCLSFDFMGTIADDTTDEQSTVMIPQGWSEFREERFPKMFFSLYNACWQKNPHRPRVECARLCLSCLVLISAFRRSFFETTAARNKYMSAVILGAFKIIKTRTGLTDDLCYHEFCRLIGKINTSHHLSELCASEPFREFPQYLFDFTMESLRSWERLPNSKHYLLGVWAHVISPLLFYKQKVPNDLELYIERITAAFIMSRMCVAEAIADDAGEPLDFIAQWFLPGSLPFPVCTHLAGHTYGSLTLLPFDWLERQTDASFLPLRTLTIRPLCTRCALPDLQTTVTGKAP